MPDFESAMIQRIDEGSEHAQRGVAKAAGKDVHFVALTKLVGSVSVGDEVLLNSTARHMELGTGGEDLVVCNLSAPERSEVSGGHIMKLRYTPSQLDVMVAEAPESPYHEVLQRTDLGGMPVVVCGLHSQMMVAVAALRTRAPGAKLAYVMGDGGALPIHHSRNVASLRSEGVLDGTVTYGHAFGGDVEAVNVYTGLIAAREVLGADAVVVSIGPGVVGTDTPLGHTEMEQGGALCAASSLDGQPIACLRVSFADPRDRHRGVSHHSVSALTIGCPVPVRIAIPKLNQDALGSIMDDVVNAGLWERHRVTVEEVDDMESSLEKLGMRPSSMGRNLSDDPAFFAAAWAAGAAGAKGLKDGR